MRARWPGCGLGLLHGRLSADDKEVAMRRFQRGEIDVLIATTVIEVGVDVPNASVMVIEHAERFGLAQMHQLRGRVGRGAAKSYCILMTGGSVSEQAEARLDAMVRRRMDLSWRSWICSSAGPASSLERARLGCRSFAWRICCATARCWSWRRWRLRGSLRSQTPAISREELDAVWARLKQQWQRRYGLVEA